MAKNAAVIQLFLSKLYSYFHILKKIDFQEHLVVFWVLKLALNTEKCPILTALTYFVLQDIKKFFEVTHSDAKIHWVSLNSLWFSSTYASVLYLYCTHFMSILIDFKVATNVVYVWPFWWLVVGCRDAHRNRGSQFTRHWVAKWPSLFIFQQANNRHTTATC